MTSSPFPISSIPLQVLMDSSQSTTPPIIEVETTGGVYYRGQLMTLQPTLDMELSDVSRFRYHRGTVTDRVEREVVVLVGTSVRSIVLPPSLLQSYQNCAIEAKETFKVIEAKRLEIRKRMADERKIVAQPEKITELVNDATLKAKKRARD
eukprot:PhF_6_TR1460/c0_g1_i1/m.2628/K11088/SNRPD3, SMD3; small nuclear ribonucleoprotein D3